MTIIEENKEHIESQPSSTTPEGASDAAADARPDENQEAEEDIDSYTREELIEILRRKVNAGSVRASVDLVREIEDAYAELRKAREQQQREEWQQDAPFRYQPDALDDTFQELLRTFREKLKEERKRFLEQLEKNYEVKKGIVERLKELAASSEFTPAHVREFRQLREQWHHTGPVPRRVREKIEQSYRFYVAALFKMQDQYFDLMKTDKAANLRIKRELLEQLQQLPAVQDPFRLRAEFRRIMEEWQHCGPVPNEHAEEIRTAFQEVKERITQQLDTLWDDLRRKEAETEARRRAIIERIEALTQPYPTRRDWENAVNEVRALVAEFHQPGPLSPKQRRQLRAALKEALDQFYGLRRQFFAAKDEESEKIARELRKKYIQRIEELTREENMKGARKIMSELVEKCEREIRRKDISPPVRARLRKELKEAKEAFLKKWADYQAKLELVEEENYKKKKAFLADLRKQVETGIDDPAAFLKKTLQQWRKLGFVPRARKKEVEEELREIIMPLMEQMGGEEGFETVRTRLLLETMPREELMDRRKKINAEIAHLANEKNKLETNLEMFGDLGGKLVENYRERVARLEEKLNILRNEQTIIKELLD